MEGESLFSVNTLRKELIEFLPETDEKTTFNAFQKKVVEAVKVMEAKRATPEWLTLVAKSAANDDVSEFIRIVENITADVNWASLACAIVKEFKISSEEEKGNNILAKKYAFLVNFLIKNHPDWFRRVDTTFFEAAIYKQKHERISTLASSLYSAAKGDIEAVRWFLKFNIDVNHLNGNALQLAVRNDHYDVIKLLLADGRIDPSIDNSKALRYGVEGKHMESVRILMNDGRSDPNAKPPGNWGMSALDIAKQYSNVELFGIVSSRNFQN